MSIVKFTYIFFFFQFFNVFYGLIALLILPPPKHLDCKHASPCPGNYTFQTQNLLQYYVL